MNEMFPLFMKSMDGLKALVSLPSIPHQNLPNQQSSKFKEPTPNCWFGSFPVLSWNLLLVPWDFSKTQNQKRFFDSENFQKTQNQKRFFDSENFWKTQNQKRFFDSEIFWKAKSGGYFQNQRTTNTRNSTTNQNEMLLGSLISWFCTRKCAVEDRFCKVSMPWVSP